MAGAEVSFFGTVGGSVRTCVAVCLRTGPIYPAGVVLLYGGSLIEEKEAV